MSEGENDNPKIEAKVGASYQRTRNTTEVIPADVTRARSGAWLDLISPMTEWAGLRGDELRHKRKLLRIQQEEVLAKIAEKTKEQLGGRPQLNNPIPVKFLVPFLEKASLEDFDSPLVDLWANLLASAATEYDSYHIHFVNVISQITAQQAEAFEYLVGTTDAKELSESMGVIDTHFTSSYVIQEEIKELYTYYCDDNGRKDAAEFQDYLKTEIQRPGIYVLYISVTDFDNSLVHFTKDENRPFYKDSDIDFSVLEAIGLVRHIQSLHIDIERFNVLTAYYHLTRMGQYFADKCKIVK